MGAPELIITIFALAILILPAYWGYVEGKKRTIGGTVGLLLGLFFSLLGVLIVYMSRLLDERPFYFPPIQSTSSAEELQKFKQLLDSGAINETEYNIQKARILNSN